MSSHLYQSLHMLSCSSHTNLRRIISNCALELQQVHTCCPATCTGACICCHAQVTSSLDGSSAIALWDCSRFLPVVQSSVPELAYAVMIKSHQSWTHHQQFRFASPRLQWVHTCCCVTSSGSVLLMLVLVWFVNEHSLSEASHWE